MSNISTFQISTRSYLGPGSLSKLSETTPVLADKRLLVVTDPNLVASGIVGRVLDVVTQAGAETFVFDAVEPNPSMDTVLKAHMRYHEAGCAGIIAVGGGSPIDTAKAVGVLAANPGTLSDYIGINKINNPLPLLIAVPTTVGTGSEVTTFAVITDLAQRKKVVLGSPLLAPNFAILDPELVVSLPANLVASTAIDAMTHAIESVMSVFATPFTDGLALEAIHLIAANLPAAVDASEIGPRANLLYASSMAGMAFSYARTGLVHAMAHPLSSYHHVSHGLANAIVLPYVMAFNLPACEDKLARVAVALGETGSPQATVDVVRRLTAQVGIPAHLSEVGVTEDFIPQMARDAFESGNAQVVNPRTPSLAEVTELYLRAL